MVYTSHFQGGTITYKLLNTYGSQVSIMITQTYIYRWPLVYCDNSYISSQSTPNISSFVEYNYKLNCVANCTTTGGYVPVSVRPYCIDYSNPMSISTTQRTDTMNLTIGAYFTVAFQSSAWRTLNLPAGSPTSKGWSISCTIDLRTRSDTGKPNTPPVANMISPIFIPVGVRKALIIPTIDSDNDLVRCRFANSTTECADVCPPSSLPNNTILISSNCTLFITGAKVNDWYAVAIQIEDYASSNSTTPLSSVPVQFLINVYNTPNCTITPLLYGPSNQTGTCQSLQVGQSNTMILYAENYCSNYSVVIDDIATLSFPIVTKSNLTRNTSTLYSVSLIWTPTASQIGSQILCAVAIDSQNVQSNQYCVAFSVSQNGTVTCPGEVVDTTTVLSMTQNIYTDTTILVDNITTTMTIDQSSIEDTTSITSSTTTTTTTTTTTSTTSVTSSSSSSSSNTMSLLMPLIIGLATLLAILCCLLPCILGLLYRKNRREVSSEPSSRAGLDHQLPRMYMLYRRFDADHDTLSTSASSLATARSANESEIHLNLSAATPRKNNNNQENIDRWAYPSPRYYHIGIVRANYSTQNNRIVFDKRFVKAYSSFNTN